MNRQAAPLAVSRENPLYVDPHTVDMGTVWAEGAAQHVLSVQNISGETVTVSRISADCTCTDVSPASFTIPPDGTQEIAVNIDATKTGGNAQNHIHRTERELTSAITFVLSDGRNQSIELHGTFAYPFAAPAAIAIREPVMIGEPPPAERFTIWRNPRIDHLSVLMDPGEAELVELESLGTPAASVFELRPNPLRILGRFHFELQVSAIDDDGREFGPLPVPVTGRVESDLAWSPQDVVLVWTDADSPPREEVVFWSRTGAAVEIEEVIGAPDFVHVELRASTENGGPYTALLTGARPVRSRSFGRVLLKGRSGAQEQLRVPISVAVESLISLE